MSRREDCMEAFLRNMETGVAVYSDESICLGVDAEKGKDPCTKCSRKINGAACGQMTCLPYYKYFKFRWRRLQKGMLGR
jgi:hypothetical protein